jgi:ATPase family associated with various cellular activities (AAA)
MPELPDPGAFGAAFEEFMHAMTAAAERPDDALTARLREHLQTEPGRLPVTAAEFPTTEHPNLQLALDAVLPGAEVVGIASRHPGFSAGLADLTSSAGIAGLLRTGPVQYVNVEVGDGRVVRCVSGGLFLVQHGGAPVALVLSRGDHAYGPHNDVLRVEGISPAEDAVGSLLAELRASMRQHNVFRGKVVSLHQSEMGQASVRFHTVADVPRESVILPPGTMERLERQAIGIAEQAERLRAAGRHLKRGVLLHGPPGTGKTLSVTYLLGAMPGRTTILLTGRGLGLIEEAVAIARELLPATVVFEDIDLVAAERMMDMGDGGALFELLNQMEGVEEDADLLFLLTTNRPDIVEPALAARPGRVDLALEIPLPDEDGRRRLLALYAEGAELDAETERDIVARTEGTTGAFIRELMRQAALRAALEGEARPSSREVIAVLDELLDERSALTRRLLGQPGEGEGRPHPAMERAMRMAGIPFPPDFDEFE